MFVVIVKTIADLDKVPPELVGKPPTYPLECVQGDNLEHLQLQFPGRTVMEVEVYKGYKLAMNEAYDNMQPPKSWWKFWSK